MWRGVESECVGVCDCILYLRKRTTCVVCASVHVVHAVGDKEMCGEWVGAQRVRI